MEEQDINSKASDVTRLLESHRLKDALEALNAFIIDSKDERTKVTLERVDELQETYRLMLQYMRQGAKDPKRNEFYRQLVAEAWTLTDQTELALLDEVSPHYYHTVYKSYYLGNKQNITLAALREKLENYPDDMGLSQLGGYQNIDDILSRHEAALQDLFLKTWTSRMWSAEEEAEAKAILTSVSMAAADVCLFVSAVTLSAQKCFDERKVHWLLDAYRNDNVQISQRALVGIAILIHLRDYRMNYAPAIKEHFMQVFEGEQATGELNRIFIQLLVNQETDRVDRQIREEIMPEMIKSITTLQRMAHEEFSDDDDDYNPDWNKEKDGELHRKELADAMSAMADWQSEGIDIYVSSFGQPMRYFPFFKKIQNWFYPFDPMHSSLVHKIGLSEFNNPDSALQHFLDVSPLCDCDKYTFCFIHQQATNDQQKQTFERLSMEVKESHSDDDAQYKQMYDRAHSRSAVANGYLHDLYRFYNLYQRAAEFYNPFDEEIRLYESGLAGPLINQTRFLLPVGDFLFGKERYKEAYSAYYVILTEHEADNPDTLQKAGFCLQKLNIFEQAISHYEQANDLKPDNVWTLRHTANCYRQLKQYNKALEYYKKVEAIDPDNRNVLLYMGHCLVELNRIEEALQYFFKLELADESNVKAWRGIAWCSLLQRKDSQAVKYYEKILAGTPNATDYLNAGHTYWIQGDLNRAVTLYSEAAKRMDRNILYSAFSGDTDLLVKQGIAKPDIALMIDMIE